MTTQMTIDMDALLERATADCLDASDLEEFCAALIRRIITLETASRVIIEYVTGFHGDGTPWCDWCEGCWVGSDDPRLVGDGMERRTHLEGGPYGILAALLGMAP
jgi:hypothetical protein